MMAPPGINQAEAKLTLELKAQREKVKHLYKVFSPTQSPEYIQEATAFNAALKEAGLDILMVVVPEAVVEVKAAPEMPSVPQALLDAGGRVWSKGEHARVYFNSPADRFDVDFGSNNKNKKANCGDLYFDLKRSDWVYTGSDHFADDIIDAARELTGL